MPGRSARTADATARTLVAHDRSGHDVHMQGSRGDDALASLLAATEQAISARRAGRFADAAAAVLRCHELIGSFDDTQRSGFAPDEVRVRLEWASTLALADDPVRALRGYERAWDAALAHGLAEHARVAAASVALIHALRGDHRYARVWLRRAADAGPDDAPPAAAAAEAVMALDRLEVEQAETWLASADGLESTEGWAVVPFLHARLALFRGSWQAAALRLRATCVAHHDGLWSSGFSARLLHAARRYLALASRDAGTVERMLPGALIRSADSTEPDIDHALRLLSTGDTTGARRVLTALIDDVHTPLRETLSAQIVLLATGDDVPSATAIRDAARQTIISEHLPAVLTELPAELVGADLRALLPAPRRVIALPALTPRERVMLAHLAGGESIRGIAAAEHISQNTVKTHLRTLYRKLGVTTRREAVAFATAPPNG